MSEESFGELGSSSPLVPPLYQSSVYTLPDLDALDRIMDGKEPGFIYARDGHPNAERLAEKLAECERASWATICSSGMAAISAVVLSVLQQGDRVLASNRLYGRTTQLLSQEMVRFGIETKFVDCNDLNQVERELDEGMKVLFAETLSNPLLRVIDVPALAELCHHRDCLLVVDNTFATPVLIRPLEHGASMVMESLTKMIGGHSDVTLGVLAGKGSWQDQINGVMSIWGLSSNPFDCWLAERGLATLPLRMTAASENAASLADWLVEQPGVTRVIYPGNPEHPDHELAQSLLDYGYGNMLCFELEGGREAVNTFMQRAPSIPFSPSLGDTTTTLSHPATTSHRYVPPSQKRRQGITNGLIRLSVGVEPLGQLQEAISMGLGL